MQREELADRVPDVTVASGADGQHLQPFPEIRGSVENHNLASGGHRVAGAVREGGQSKTKVKLREACQSTSTHRSRHFSLFAGNRSSFVEFWFAVARLCS